MRINSAVIVDQVRELFAVADTLNKADADQDTTDGSARGSQEASSSGSRKGMLLNPMPQFIDKEFAYVEFNASQVAVLERSKRATVLLRRRGNTDLDTTVRVETIDGKCYYKVVLYVIDVHILDHLISIWRS